MASIRYLTIIFSFMVAIFSTCVNAEKYFTWVDEMGRVHHSLIPEEENPLIKKESKKSQESKAKDATDSNNQANQRVEPDSIESSQQSPIETIKSAAPTPEAETLTTVPETEAASVPATKPLPAVVINEDDYIDGDVLLEQGGVRSDDDLPYYTWTDEQGRMRNTPYRPKEMNGKSKGGEAAKAKKPKPVYSVSEEYVKSDLVTVTGQSEVDGFAKNLFFDKNSPDFIEQFASKCCDDLIKDSPEALTDEEGVYLEIDRDTSSHLFSEGRSPYKLVELPHIRGEYSLKLKSFVKTSGKTGVKNGVFFPQIVFLDHTYKPVRILRNPVLQFVPENWHRHGYLKGLFKVDGNDSSRYILINTTKENLRARNAIENKKVVVLKNQKVGSIELELQRN